MALTSFGFSPFLLPCQPQFFLCMAPVYRSVLTLKMAGVHSRWKVFGPLIYFGSAPFRRSSKRYRNAFEPVTVDEIPFKYLCDYLLLTESIAPMWGISFRFRARDSILDDAILILSKH